MSKAFEWRAEKYGYFAKYGPLEYRIYVSMTGYIQAEATVPTIYDDDHDENGSKEGFPTLDDAKAWCESHYRGWYNSLPKPPEATA